MMKANEIAQALALNPGLAAAMDELFASFQEQAGETDLAASAKATAVPPPQPEQVMPEQGPLPMSQEQTIL